MSSIQVFSTPATLLGKDAVHSTVPLLSERETNNHARRKERSFATTETKQSTKPLKVRVLGFLCTAEYKPIYLCSVYLHVRGQLIKH